MLRLQAHGSDGHIYVAPHTINEVKASPNTSDTPAATTCIIQTSSGQRVVRHSAEAVVAARQAAMNMIGFTTAHGDNVYDVAARRWLRVEAEEVKN